MSNDIFGVLARVADNNVMLWRMESFARALKTAIKSHDLQIDGMRFVPDSGRPDEADMLHTGRHTTFYRLDGTDKLYRVMIEPVPETHR